MPEPQGLPVGQGEDARPQVLPAERALEALLVERVPDARRFLVLPAEQALRGLPQVLRVERERHARRLVLPAEQERGRELQVAQARGARLVLPEAREPVGPALERASRGRA